MALTIPRFSSHAGLQAASENRPPLQQWARGESVAVLQQALVDLGFAMPQSTGQGKRLPDGIFGNETLATVKQFQRVNGLKVDGVVGRQTLAVLERLIVEASKIDEGRFTAAMFQSPPIA